MLAVAKSEAGTDGGAAGETRGRRTAIRLARVSTTPTRWHLAVTAYARGKLQQKLGRTEDQERLLLLCSKQEAGSSEGRTVHFVNGCQKSTDAAAAPRTFSHHFKRLHHQLAPSLFVGLIRWISTARCWPVSVLFRCITAVQPSSSCSRLSKGTGGGTASSNHWPGCALL
jgi:hypothetical protein